MKAVEFKDLANTTRWDRSIPFENMKTIEEMSASVWYMVKPFPELGEIVFVDAVDDKFDYNSCSVDNMRVTVIFECPFTGSEEYFGVNPKDFGYSFRLHTVSIEEQKIRFAVDVFGTPDVAAARAKKIADSELATIKATLEHLRADFEGERQALREFFQDILDRREARKNRLKAIKDIFQSSPLGVSL